MKQLFPTIIICFLSAQIFYGQDEVLVNKQALEDRQIELNWMPTYEKALKKSKKERKPLLIYFTGSDWCGPCKILDKNLFHTEKFKTIADKNLILLEVDIPRRIDILSAKKMKQNKIIQNKYKVRSFPTLMIVNHKGKKIAEKKGYILTEYYYPFLRSQIDKY